MIKHKIILLTLISLISLTSCSPVNGHLYMEMVSDAIRDQNMVMFANYVDVKPNDLDKQLNNLLIDELYQRSIKSEVVYPKGMEAKVYDSVSKFRKHEVQYEIVDVDEQTLEVKLLISFSDVYSLFTSKINEYYIANTTTTQVTYNDIIVSALQEAMTTAKQKGLLSYQFTLKKVKSQFYIQQEDIDNMVEIILGVK